MSSQRVNAVEKDLEKYIKFLALKSAQVIVQSRLGEKLQTNCNPLSTGNDWFNLEIQDHPDVSAETKGALGLGPNVSILHRLPLCIEISVKTVEGDQMVLEVWSLDILPNGQRSAEDRDVTDAAILKGVSATTNNEQTLKAAHAIYNRMGMLLKSLISLTRVTPAYKLSRCQCPEAYTIYYRIYVDRPQVQLLGDGCKYLLIGQLNTIVGTLKMDCSYRTKMTISPTTAPVGQKKGETNTIMLKSDHFNPNDIATTPSQNTGLNGLAFGKKGLNGCNGTDRKMIDIEKPLKPGAFADITKLKQYTEEDYVLPETPPFEWLLRKRNESCGSGSLESLNRKSESPASSPLTPSILTTTNVNNNCNANAIVNINNNKNNNSSNINNNVPALKGFECNGVSEKSTKPTAATSPTNVPSTLSQSPLKSLLVPVQCATTTTTAKRHGSTSSLTPTTAAAAAATTSGTNSNSSGEDDNLLKELNFPFSSPSPNNELAKFFRDCYHAPKLQSLTLEVQPEMNSSTCSSVAASYNNVDSSDFAVIDDLSRQLEQFETSMEDYDKLVSSLAGSSSTGSRSSGGGLQMSN